MGPVAAASADHNQPVAPYSAFCYPRCFTTQEEYQSAPLDDGSTRTARCLVQRPVFALGESVIVFTGSFGLPSGIVQMIGLASLGLSHLAKRPRAEDPIMIRDMHAGVATTFQ